MADFEPIKQMPFSLEAEQAVLGTVIMDSERFADVADLSSEDFYLQAHREIFLAMQDMFTKNRGIDVVTLIDSLTRLGLYTEGDAAKYIKTLVDLASETSQLEEYKNIIRDKSILRKLIDASREISDTAYNEKGEVSDIVNFAEQKIYSISQDKYKEGFDRISDVIREQYAMIRSLRDNPNALKGTPTRFEALDRVLVGMGKGDLIVVGGRPGMGKTSFCMNIAANVAKSTDKNIAIFSLEMSSEQLVSRMLCSEALIDNTNMRTGRLDDDDWRHLAEATSVLSKTNIFIDPSTTSTPSAMKAKLRRLDNVGLVVIDYLQLMQADVPSENVVQNIQSITRALKLMAKEFEIPVILCSQLRRESDKGKDRRPGLSDLRDSGAIEQDADIVVFLYRSDYYTTSEGGRAEKSEEPQSRGDQITAECNVAKNRHGSPGTVKLAWIGKYFKFMSIEENIGNDTLEE